MFLLMLAVLPFALNTISFFFVRLLPPSKPLLHMPNSDSESQVLHMAKSHDGQDQGRPESEGPTTHKSAEVSGGGEEHTGAVEEAEVDIHETSSLLSKSSDSGPEEYGFRKSSTVRSEEVDIRGLALLGKHQFWQLFFMFALLTGIGLMNIK